MRTLTPLFISLALLTPACGDGGGGESTGTEPATTTTATTSTTAPDLTTGSSAETTVGGSAETSTSGPVVTTGPGDTTDVTTEPAETTATTEPAETTTTGPGETTTGETGPLDTTLETLGTTTAGGLCDALPEMVCAQTPGCMPIVAGKINVMKMCTNKLMFLACVEEAGCGDAITYGCEIGVDPPEPYEFPSTCQPADFEACDPGMLVGPCK